MGVFMDKPINFHIGFESEYGEQRWGAWGDGDSATFYPDAIPHSVADEALNWTPVQAPMMFTDTNTGMPRPYGSVADDGTYSGPMVVLHGRTGEPLGYNGGKTALGGYWPWFMGGASEILQTNVHDIGLAMLALVNAGSTAIVQIDLLKTVGDSVTGIDFRPFMWMSMALDGSRKPGAGTGHTRMVCRNTMAAGFGEAAASGHIWTPGKQTKGLAERGINWTEARQALDLLSVTSDSLTAEFRTMCETPVPTPTWHAFLDRWTPTTDGKTGEALTGRSLTMAENKRDALQDLWVSDVRVAPWKNTVFGVSQAVTTYGQHMSIVRNVSRIERNAVNLMNGKAQEEETRALSVLREVMAVSA